eukprot:m.280008 g.280008  ORF g.280008 m.280008 type:complete len:231 (-) comp16324_c2_seq5:83-775(-)
MGLVDYGSDDSDDSDAPNTQITKVTAAKRKASILKPKGPSLEEKRRALLAAPEPIADSDSEDELAAKPLHPKQSYDDRPTPVGISSLLPKPVRGHRLDHVPAAKVFKTVSRSSVKEEKEEEESLGVQQAMGQGDEVHMYAPLPTEINAAPSTSTAPAPPKVFGYGKGPVVIPDAEPEFVPEIEPVGPYSGGGEFEMIMSRAEKKEVRAGRMRPDAFDFVDIDQRKKTGFF